MTRWPVLWTAVLCLGVGFYVLASRHRFRPDPLRPSHCAVCGRAADKHDT